MNSKILQLIANNGCKLCGCKKCACKKTSKSKDVLLSVLALAALGGTAYYLHKKSKEKPLPVADYVDLEKYMGIWYEIARFPKCYEKDTTNNMAEYTLNTKGYVEVKNTALQINDDGNKIVSIEGKAFVSDKATNAKLKVSFFPPLCSKYWIIAVDDDYQWAVVGTPDRESFWILSREKTMDKILLSHLLGMAFDLGFDIEKTIFTRHNNGSSPKSNRNVAAAEMASKEENNKKEAENIKQETDKEIKHHQGPHHKHQKRHKHEPKGPKHEDDKRDEEPI